MHTMLASFTAANAPTHGCMTTYIVAVNSIHSYVRVNTSVLQSRLIQETYLAKCAEKITKQNTISLTKPSTPRNTSQSLGVQPLSLVNFISTRPLLCVPCKMAATISKKRKVCIVLIFSTVVKMVHSGEPVCSHMMIRVHLCCYKYVLVS